MSCGYHFVQVAATANTYSYTSVVVSASCNTWLVGCTHSPCVIVVPEGVACDMSCLLVFLVFQVGCGEIFPGVVILGFVLVGEGGLYSLRIAAANAYHDMVAVTLGECACCQ